MGDNLILLTETICIFDLGKPESNEYISFLLTSSFSDMSFEYNVNEMLRIHFIIHNYVGFFYRGFLYKGTE